MQIRRTLLRLIPVILIAAIAIVAIRFVLRELKQLSFIELSESVQKLPSYAIPLALLAVIGTYLALTMYDRLAGHYVGRSLGRLETIGISFIAFVMSFNVGLSALGGMAIRYRMYSVRGYSTENIAKLVLFIPVSYSTGFVFLAGIGLTTGGIGLPDSFGIPDIALRILGVVLLAAWVAFVITCWIRKDPINFRSWKIPLPPVKFIPIQAAIAAVEILLAALAFYMLLPADKPDFIVFVGIFMVATFLGLISHVPSGLGVFDSAILLGLKPYLDDASILGGLVLFRVLYYIIPLILATGLLGIFEWVSIRRGLASAGEQGTRLAQAIAPRVLAGASLLSGVSLLVTGATPIIKGRVSWLESVLPLGAVEASHFLGSIVGVILLFQAHALIRRIDVAFYSSLVLLGVGALLSVGKGEFGAAALSFFVFLAFLPCKRAFFRKSSLLQQRFSPTWLASVAAILISTIWLGFFAYRNVDYTSDLWWKVSYRSDASRFLRATTGAAVVALYIGFWQILKSRKPSFKIASTEELEKAGELIKRASRTNANLAYLGDKALLFSDTGNTMLMYGVSGDVWISIGGPIGDEKEFPSLVWKFRELCDANGDVPVFYNIGERSLALFLSAGFSISKIGEEAMMDLTSFSLAGGSRKNLRAAINKAERIGCTFEVIGPEQVTATLPELRNISDQWLNLKRASEKSFTLGRFAESYLSRFPVALVRQNGAIIAFANLWVTESKEELAIDLMRHKTDAPPETMQYLFGEIMQWGAVQGYARFNMGMAPLAGLEEHPLAPAWNRVGSFIFERGESFYNFQGLRQFKDKFDPIWEPRYIASLGGARLPQALIEISRLSAGGWLQLFK